MTNHDHCPHCEANMDVRFIHKIISYEFGILPQQILLISTRCHECGFEEYHQFFWRPGETTVNPIELEYKQNLN